MDVQVGDVIQTKKPHPCGANRFDVLRVGMDFKIKCQGCAEMIGHSLYTMCNPF